MKKELLILLILTVAGIIAAESCASPSPKLNKFVGEWQRIDKSQRDLVIKLDDDAIIISYGKDEYAAIYDAHKNTLKSYVFSGCIISYNDKNSHILVNKGEDGEYKRVK